MKYYSKSPKEVREHFQIEDQKSQKKLTRGRFILLLDIVILAMILYLFKDMILPEKKAELNSVHALQWKAWHIEGRCSENQTCTVQLQAIKEHSWEPQEVKWEVFTSDGSIIYSNSKPLVQTENKQVSTLILSEEIENFNPSNTIQVTIPDESSDNSSDDAFGFTLYP